MASTQQTAFRLPVTLLKRLDAYTDSLRADQPGMIIARADAVRLLLTKAMDDLDTKEEKRGKK